MRRLAVWLLVACAVRAFAQDDPVSVLDPGSLNSEGALQAVAHRLFAPPPGTLFSITKQHEHLKFHQQCEFDRYGVTESNGKHVGDFVRMRVYPPGDSVVDLALVLDEGKILAAEPVRPVVILRTPLLDLPSTLTGLKSKRLAPEAARGLAKLFSALANLDQVAETPALPLPAPEQEQALAAAVKAAYPGLPVGKPIPEISGTDSSGKPFTTAALKGKPAVLVMASVDHELGRETLGWLHRYMRAHGNRFQLVEIIQNLPESIERYRGIRERFEGLVVGDFDETLHEKLGGGFTPCVLVVDRRGILKAELQPPFGAYEALQTALDPVR